MNSSFSFLYPNALAYAKTMSGRVDNEGNKDPALSEVSNDCRWVPAPNQGYCERRIFERKLSFRSRSFAGLNDDDAPRDERIILRLELL